MENEMGCGLCHPYARRSSVAGMPSMQRCVGCHKFIAADKPAVRELLAAYDKQEAIPWVPVFRVPDHVIFTHQPHVRASLACADCHGAIATMDVVHRDREPTMGWCLECHRQKQASIECLRCHK
jgi:hypothetical protein